MDKDTLIGDLGTIAQSGSGKFKNDMKNVEDGNADNIIG